MKLYFYHLFISSCQKDRFWTYWIKSFKVENCAYESIAFLHRPHILALCIKPTNHNSYKSSNLLLWSTLNLLVFFHRYRPFIVLLFIDSINFWWIDFSLQFHFDNFHKRRLRNVVFAFLPTTKIPSCIINDLIKL